MTKPILMIHREEDWMFDLPLEKFILTFDDGYRDHWDTFDRFLQIPTKKIYFVTGGWIGQDDFLSSDHIHEMMRHSDVEIGAHGFRHHRIARSDLDQMTDIMESEAADTVEWFQRTIGAVPTKFCYPFNDCVHGLYTQILRQHGFREFYGPERIDIFWFRDEAWIKANKDWILDPDVR